ncbi:anthrone oxygenase family protein [Chitinophaga sp. 212800010-3]|uniref:anthrone oxygenase family protein n=1 Tax=unclassified Chitinophaga TaxID=2619133 RepID=UPI002DE43F08|nr:DUF1772 domain-containing protein [Chitinophaga sp. 212800010-3]
MKTILLALALITTSLVTGVFYAFAVSVIPAFSQLSDATYMDAMQQINIAIVNPAFLLSFMGAPVLLPVVTWLYSRPAFTRRSALLLAATVIFVIGTFGVTVAGNIPLNDKLAAFQLQGATAAQIRAARGAFEGPWNSLHMVRTLAGMVALVLVVAACLTKDKQSS